METTLGTSLFPSAPGMISGPVRSMNATRLFVVPRSIPTIRGCLPKSICNVDILLRRGSERPFHFCYEILDVLPAVQRRANLRENLTIVRRVVFLEQRLQLAVGFRKHAA